MEQTIFETVKIAKERATKLHSEYISFRQSARDYQEKAQDKQSDYFASLKAFDNSVGEYWATNGGLVGKCFTANLDENDWSGRMGDATRVFFKILGTGRIDGNNQPINLGEWFEINEEEKSPIGHQCEWFYIPMRLMSPTNLISEEEYNKAKADFKAQWQKKLGHTVDSKTE